MPFTASRYLRASGVTASHSHWLSNIHLCAEVSAAILVLNCIFPYHAPSQQLYCSTRLSSCRGWIIVARHRCYTTAVAGPFTARSTPTLAFHHASLEVLGPSSCLWAVADYAWNFRPLPWIVSANLLHLSLEDQPLLRRQEDLSLGVQRLPPIPYPYPAPSVLSRRQCRPPQLILSMTPTTMMPARSIFHSGIAHLTGLNSRDTLGPLCSTRALCICLALFYTMLYLVTLWPEITS